MIANGGQLVKIYDDFVKENFLMVKIHDIKNYNGEGVPVDIYERGALP